MKSLNKMLRCRCNPGRGIKSRRFILLLNHFLKQVQLKSGMSCRKPRAVMRPIASALDSFVDQCRMVKNPFYFNHPQEEDFEENIDAILNLCRITRPLPFKIALPKWSLCEVEKISEGSYGEVYLSKNFSGEERILKTMLVCGEHPSNPWIIRRTQDALIEAVTSNYLSSLRDNKVFQAPNFPKLYNMDMVTGKPPVRLVKAWKNFYDDTIQDEEEFSHGKPDRYSSDTLLLVMELENCGDPFFSERIFDSREAMALILQTASALAVAECAFQFEHRDLHPGNWLFRRTQLPHFTYKTDRFLWTIESRNVQAFIIDFSLSRLTINDEIVASELVPDGAEKANFCNHFYIYDISNKELERDKTNYRPRTNLFWLKHIVDNMIVSMSDFTEYTEIDDMVLYLLQRISGRILNYRSAMDFIKSEIFHDSLPVR